uniref:Uncharacterized protein n=1 Tax=Anopheles darlingi TaxID=43151 RepID=A0A2M4DEB0_ANODA
MADQFAPPSWPWPLYTRIVGSWMIVVVAVVVVVAAAAAAAAINADAVLFLTRRKLHYTASGVMQVEEAEGSSSSGRHFLPPSCRLLISYTAYTATLVARYWWPVNFACVRGFILVLFCFYNVLCFTLFYCARLMDVCCCCCWVTISRHRTAGHCCQLDMLLLLLLMMLMMMMSRVTRRAGRERGRTEGPMMLLLVLCTHNDARRGVGMLLSFSRFRSF